MYWKSHIEMITPKLNEACFMIRITRSILSLESLKMIYYACFHSIITQGLLLGGNSSQCQHIFCLPWHNSPRGTRPPQCRGIMITLRHTKVGKTPLSK